MENFAGKKNIRLDLIVIAVILLIGAVLGAFLFMSRKDGSAAQVRVSGAVIAQFPLDRDCEYLIPGKDDGTNHLVIQDGEAFVDAATCPDGICMSMGKIHIAGESVICLPNEVVVEIVDSAESDKPKFDSVIGGK